MYCDDLHCAELVPCSTHGGNESQSLLERVKEKAYSVTETIKGAFAKDKGDEVKTHSLEESVMQMPSAGQGGTTSETISTEYETAHTWEQQHEGGLGHRAKETARAAAEVIGEKAVGAAETIKDKAAEVHSSLAEKGHSARVKIENALERNFGAEAELLQAEGEKARKSAQEDTARAAELVRDGLGGAASSLRQQELAEKHKTKAETLQEYHTHGSGPIDDVVERNFGVIAEQAILEGQTAKEGAIHETTRTAELVQEQFGNAAASLREQQRNEQQS